jgi:hypothetical protein
MKTTQDLPDDLVKQGKLRAVKEGRVADILLAQDVEWHHAAGR